MVELNSTIFYKIKFDMTAIDPNTDLIWKVIYHMKSWLLRKWNSNNNFLLPTSLGHWSYLKSGSRISSTDNKSVHIISKSFVEAEDSIYWACRISERREPNPGYAPRVWNTEIGIKPLAKGKVEFSFVTYFIDHPGFIGFCEDEPAPNIPNLIKNILADSGCTCSFGCDLIDLKPKELHAGDWLDVWKKMQNPARKLPYIFISSKYDSETKTSDILVNPESLAVAAGGNALVYFTNDFRVIKEMNYHSPEDYRCYGGAIRIYFPGLDSSVPVDYLRHRYIDENMISTHGENSIYHMIRRALAQDVHFYDTFFRIADCERLIEQQNLQLRLDDLKKRHYEEKESITNKSEKELKEYFDLAESEELKRLEAENALTLVQNELRKEKEINFNLSTEIETYRPLAQKNASLERACNSRFNTKKYPDSVRDIINYFEAVFGDRIAFTDEVDKTIKDCNIPFSELWESLFSLSTVMYDLYNTGDGDIYSTFKCMTGIDVSRGEGAMTRKDNKLMKQFFVNYNGEEINIEPHITFPKIKQSIHFGYSQNHQKLVVGSCGEHKEIYSSRKQR